MRNLNNKGFMALDYLIITFVVISLSLYIAKMFIESERAMANIKISEINNDVSIGNHLKS